MPDEHHEATEIACTNSHGSSGIRRAFGKRARDPHVHGRIFREAFPVHQKQRHLVLGIEAQEVRRHLLLLAEIERLDAERRAGLRQGDERHEGAGVGRVVENDIHAASFR